MTSVPFGDVALRNDASPLDLQTDELLLMYAAMQGGRPSRVLPRCRHALAYCAPTGVTRSLADRGQSLSARRVTRLKLALPVADHLRREVQRELDALERSEVQP